MASLFLPHVQRGDMGAGRIQSLCLAVAKRLSSVGDIGERFGEYFGDMTDIGARFNILVQCQGLQGLLGEGAAGHGRVRPRRQV